MCFMEDKAAERHTDCLMSMCVQMHESCRMRFMEEKAAAKLQDRLIKDIPVASIMLK